MIKKLTKHGNSLALVIDKPILEMLNIDEETPLSITTNGERIVISPAWDEETEKRFQAALGKGIQKYGKMLKRLAD
jgi:antitoxin component of MazEF toxin-antitoxin module